MDDALKARIEEFREQFITVAAEVDAAADSNDEPRELAAGDTVRELVAKWNALLSELQPTERKSVEIQFERRMLDVRRAAGQLTQRVSGQRAERAADAGSPFLFSRQPPKSIEPDRYALRSRNSVGSEVEAWCGKCKEIREHRIVAMVGDEPKQVVCNTCGSRHNFKTEQPTRGKGAAAPKTATGEPAPKKGSPEEREAQKRADAKRALQKELAEAPEPRQFDPKGRYKAGEIIQHPEHGRGKIENVLRSSLLVRFLDGLKPLDLA
jgi:hypothetical protein